MTEYSEQGRQFALQRPVHAPSPAVPKVPENVTKSVSTPAHTAVTPSVPKPTTTTSVPPNQPLSPLSPTVQSDADVEGWDNDVSKEKLGTGIIAKGEGGSQEEEEIAEDEQSWMDPPSNDKDMGWEESHAMEMRNEKFERKEIADESSCSATPGVRVTVLLRTRLGDQ